MEPERRQGDADFPHGQHEGGLLELGHHHSRDEEPEVAPLDRAAAVVTVLPRQSLEGLACRGARP